MFGLFHINRPIVNIESLPSSSELEEADQLECGLYANKESCLKVKKIIGDSATIKAVLQVQCPFILHFTTHTFSMEKKSKNLYMGEIFGQPVPSQVFY